MNDEQKKLFLKQGYHIVGSHSAVKLCHWMRQKLYYNRPCYKEHFYGIQCHRCLQMSPVIDDCTQECLFCWRYPCPDGMGKKEWDLPENLLDRIIRGQRMLISGFKGDERCNLVLWKEAQNPNQVAISLAGEPTLYPYLSDFILECRRRNMTTFLVTNGTKPEVISELDCLPTQLYVTVAAPNEQIYRKLCLPHIKDGWERLNATLSLLPSLGKKTRTVIRHTLVDGWNIGWEEQYSKMTRCAEPDFIECKGYMFVGHSRLTMTMENMPSFAKIKEFAEKISLYTEYILEGGKGDSRVAVLSSGRKNIRLNS